MTGFTLIMLFGIIGLYPVLFSWVICRSASRNRSPGSKRKVWLTLGFAMLGVYVWAPSILFFGPTRILDWTGVILVGCLGCGSITGFALGSMLESMPYDDPDDTNRDRE